jgi:cation diffusion facilitator CzcD-associated flavoprotein CzcO
VRCDIPSHVYQSTFAPKKDWSDQFSFGGEILSYWRSVARDHDAYRYAKFNHNVEHAEWNNESGTWILKLNDLKNESGAHETTEVDIVVTATGRFNAWKLPDYPGISDFKGHLRHASNYDPAFDPKGKKVAVIGNGASGIQLVANLQKVVGQLDHYVRKPTWIATSWAGDDRTFEPQPISEEQKQAHREDDPSYLEFRKEMEDKYWRRFDTFLPGTGNDDLRERFVGIMKQRLERKPHLIEKIVPDFPPNCRRLTPGPGYLEAVTEDNVDYITTPIRRFTASGIETEDGVHREVDAVFCATGANRDMVPVFPIRANGQDLREIWSQDGPYGFPYSYQGLSTPGFPNLFFIHGPNATGPSGTVPHSVETQLAHVAKILRKISREGIKSVTPSVKATDDFVEYCDAFFARTVLASGCSSWYNGGLPGSRIHGLWPGSAAHLTIVRREPRFEDWEYEYLAEGGNRFLWYFGNGWTRKERDPESDMTPYLRQPGEVDLRDVHESWWSWP